MSDYGHFLDLVSKDQLKMVDTLIQWASINSGSHNHKGLQEMAKVCASAFFCLPAKLEIIYLTPNRLPVIYLVCRPEASLRILFNGHMDTVYGENHPFQKCTLLNENILRGPGVTDMKGGLVVLLEVLKVFEKTPWAKNIGWEVLLVPDEEIGSIYSSPLLEDIAKRNHLGLIFEPSFPDGSLVRSRKGTALFTVTAIGKAGHAGRNFVSEDNAIIGLSRFLLRVDEFNKELSGCTFNIGSIEGGGVVNIIPEHAQAKIGVRYTSFTDKGLIEKRFQELAEEFNQSHKVQIKVNNLFMRPPKVSSVQQDELFKEFELCGKELGIVLGWKDSGGASDGNNLSASGLINIDNLGVQGDNIHSDEEYVVLESLTQRTQLTLLFLMKLASHEITLPNDPFNSRSVF